MSSSQIPARYVSMPRPTMSGAQYGSSFITASTPTKARRAFPVSPISDYSKPVDEYVRVYMIDLVMPDLVESVQKSLIADLHAGFRAEANKFSDLDWMFEDLEVKPV